MRYVPAGEFTMGIDGELEKEICPGLATNQTCINIARGGYSSVHPVYLDAYYMDVYEVTVAQFVEFLNEVGNEGVSEGHITSWPEVIVGPVPWVRIQAEHPFENDILEEDGVFSVPEGFDNHPVEVTWYGAQGYCEWRGALLPTEAQWEKAARGTDGRIFPWGDDFIVTYANVREPNEDGHQYTAPIGSFPEGASPYGMLDMAGNVWEWVADWYWDYDFSLYENPIGPEEPVTDYLGNLHPVRVVRGGDYGQEAFLANSTYRYYYEPGYEWSGFGFRCASPTSLP
jgi:formylglycine-generating enzyme required for sulfatase activity